MVNRIYIGSDRVTMSKPGYDAVSPPAVDYKYLSLDSRLDQGRPLEVGYLPSHVFGNAVYYSTTYPYPPAVDVFVYGSSGGSAGYMRRIVMRDDNGSTAYQRTCYYITPRRNYFQVVDRAVNYRSTLFGQTLQLYYIAWNIRS